MCLFVWSYHLLVCSLSPIFVWYLKLSVKRSSTAERWSIAKIKVPQSWRVAQILFGPISNKSVLIAVFCLSSAATPPKHLQYSFTLRLGREAVFPAKLLCSPLICCWEESELKLLLFPLTDDCLVSLHSLFPAYKPEHVLLDPLSTKGTSWALRPMQQWLFLSVLGAKDNSKAYIRSPAVGLICFYQNVSSLFVAEKV